MYLPSKSEEGIKEIPALNNILANVISIDNALTEYQNIINTKLDAILPIPSQVVELEQSYKTKSNGTTEYSLMNVDYMLSEILLKVNNFQYTIDHLNKIV